MPKYTGPKSGHIITMLPNPNSDTELNARVCEHAPPTDGTKKDQWSMCADCFDEYKAGAFVLDEQGDILDTNGNVLRAVPKEVQNPAQFLPPKRAKAGK